eukprot:jgi/Ulvmu1/5333/UM022_0127.1
MALTAIPALLPSNVSTTSEAIIMMFTTGIVSVLVGAAVASTPAAAAAGSADVHGRGLSFSIDPYHAEFFKKDVFAMKDGPERYPSPYSPAPDDHVHGDSDDHGNGDSSPTYTYPSTTDDHFDSPGHDDSPGHIDSSPGYPRRPTYTPSRPSGPPRRHGRKKKALKEFFRKVRKGAKANKPDGHEGVTGPDAYTVHKGSTVAVAVCHSKASAYAQSAMKNAHVAVSEYAILSYCDPEWDGDTKEVYDYALDEGYAIAKAVAATQADCVTKGSAFGCTSASATATAWAEATAEAHSLAVAKAFDKCHCHVETSSLSVAHAETYIELSADVFSHAEVFACSSGDSSSWAAAYSKCTAIAYAQVWTKAYAQAFLHTGCLSSAAETKVLAATGGDFIEISGCEKIDKADGDAYSTTDGSSAHAHAAEYYPAEN